MARFSRPAWLLNLALGLAPMVLALLFTTLILLAAGANPLTVFERLWAGAFGTAIKQADVLTVWVSLAVAAAGLLVTFTAGQWNIGVEGQIMFGAIAATWSGRWFVNAEGQWVSGAPLVVIVTMIGAGALGGVVWAMLAAALKVFGRVHEIFGGLGLNFIATAVSIYLMFGPWKQPTGGTLSGTVLLDKQLWLPAWDNLRVSAYAVIAALIVALVVYFALRGTLWGLRLKAVGRNARGARLLGVRPHRSLFSAYAVCGACAGLVGAYLVLGVHHHLIPGISSGYGFLGVLIVLLAGFNGLWTLPIALFFAAIGIGSTTLQLDLQLDASLGGVLQGAVVLSVLFVQGLRERWFR
jgi:simple sugar transport system permease protein